METKHNLTMKRSLKLAAELPDLGAKRVLKFEILKLLLALSLRLFIIFLGWVWSSEGVLFRFLRV